jgi:RNA polymerase sigma-70 factor, ECF subfamily
MKKYLKNNLFSLIENEYTMNYSYLRNFLLKLTHDDKLSEDIVQEVFSRLLKNPETILEVQYMKSWLVSIAKNILIDHYRKKNPTLFKDGEVIGELLVDNLHPEAKMLNREVITTSLANLTHDEKTLFLAREYYGYSYDEISSLMGVPVNTIKSRLFRVRKKLLLNLERGEKDG